MGLFSFLGGSKTERLVKKVTNAWVQTVERQRALQLLADDGSEEALHGILQRFTFRTEGSIVDEDEKRMAFDFIVAAGPKAIAPIERYVSENVEVYWPLKALREIAGLDVAVDLMLRVLDKAEKVDTRVNDHKAQLVSNLRDFPHDRIRDRLLSLAEDPNEDVRIQALDGLSTYGSDVALEVIVRRILDPEESASVKAVVYEQLVELGWSLEPWAKQLSEADALPPIYRLGPKGVLGRS